MARVNALSLSIVDDTLLIHAWVYYWHGYYMWPQVSFMHAVAQIHSLHCISLPLMCYMTYRMFFSTRQLRRDEPRWPRFPWAEPRWLRIAGVWPVQHRWRPVSNTKVGEIPKQWKCLQQVFVTMIVKSFFSVNIDMDLLCVLLYQPCMYMLKSLLCIYLVVTFVWAFLFLENMRICNLCSVSFLPQYQLYLGYSVHLLGQYTCIAWLILGNLCVLTSFMICDQSSAVYCCYALWQHEIERFGSDVVCDM